MADVFVSYCRRDKVRVAPLVAEIQARGWSVWWDPQIAPGQEFDRLIDAELAAASAVLVVWTKDSVESRWVRGEAREAADRGILVPVRFDRATLPIDVRSFHTIDLEEGSEAQAGEVLRALGALVEGRGIATPGPPASAPATQGVAVAGAPGRTTICVLPFANLGGGDEQRYFSDGITEDLITELSRWRSLAVRSRAASFRYRGAAADLRQVARELDVQFVVEGSVRRMGERIRISAQVVDTGTGNHVWAEKFDRELAGIFDVQDQLVRTIVGTLVGRVQASDAERARRKPPANLAAYECVLEGNALAWSDPGGAAQATRLFEQAIALDPGYGFAHALLAAMRNHYWFDDPGDSRELLDEAYALATRAVALDANESTCFSILAMVCLLRRKFDLARQHILRAVALNPNNQWNAADMGLCLVHLGQPEEALAWFARAREIDPYFDAAWHWRERGLALLLLGREAEALGMLERASTRSYRIAAYEAACHARLGNQARARDCAAECLALNPDFSVARYMAKDPYEDPDHAARLADALRLAGLPG